MSTVLWFRKGLRLHDNPALVHCLSTSPASFLPIFIQDPAFADESKVGYNRMRFLCQSLVDLDAQLRELGSKLIVLSGRPTEVLPRLLFLLRPNLLAFEHDTEPYALDRDAQVAQAAEQLGVQVFSPVGHTLYDPDLIVQRNGGSPPLTYQGFLRILSSLAPPSLPLPAPSTRLPPLDPLIEPILLDEGLLFDGPDASPGGIPTPEALGYNAPDPALLSPFHGGETEALRRLDAFLTDRRAYALSFKKPDTDPTAFDPFLATTVLSPYLKFGCLSPRLFYHRLIALYSEGPHSEPPQSLLGQLLFREHFYTVSSHVPNFDRMERNPICKQIPWGRDLALLKAWEEGRTGYPFIDACMRQLAAWGWIHHLARHAVACFLTRGDLWVHWELGRDVFDRLLLDSDWALNNANWMWLSASAFYSEYYRVYSPISFAEKYEGHARFIKHFVPELARFPDKYILSPWTAPIQVQREAGCVIGTDYPKPIVNHDAAKAANLKKMEAAYQAHAAQGLPDVWARNVPNKSRESDGKNALLQGGAGGGPTGDGAGSSAGPKQPLITQLFAKKGG